MKRAMNHSTKMMLFAASAVTVLALPAAAITITPTFNNGASVHPTFDPAGTNLTALFNYAAGFYNDVFENNFNVAIDFAYDATLPANVLAQHVLTGQSGGHETAGQIRVNPNFNWFQDATPGDSSEFTMSQTLWRDLSSIQQTDLLNAGAAIPATFEVA